MARKITDYQLLDHGIISAADVRRNSRPYVGLKAGKPSEVFRSAETPTEETHGHLYAAVIGPFRTMRGARFMAQCGKGNPHLQTVADAERIAKLATSTV